MAKESCNMENRILGSRFNLDLKKGRANCFIRVFYFTDERYEREGKRHIQDYCLDLSSDHTPIIATISNTIIEFESLPTLTNRHTDWDYFLSLIHI